MHKNFLFIVVAFFTTSLLAQDCEFYIPLEENRGYQYQHFDRRDRETGHQDVIIQKVTKHSDYTEALVQSKFFDNRNRMQHEGEFTIRCKGNELLLDIESLMDPTMMEAFQDMEVSITGDNISLPSGMKVGDELPEAHMDMKVSSAGITITEVTFITRNRKVEDKVTLTTPAGTFECFKISYENYMETRAMGIPTRVTTRTVEYFAPGVGNVRTENYNRRDRLDSYTVLSKIY